LIFLVILGFFVFCHLAGRGIIDIDRIVGPCGFKQRYGLPCPTCGMTSSALAFAQGKIIESFYYQPAGGLFCSALAVTAFLAFLVAVFGVYFRFLRRLFAEVTLVQVILAVITVILAGWAVTFARALAERGSP